MIKFLPRRVICSALITLGLSASAFASGLPATGLGQSWPNAPDVSSSPHWHVYVFVRDGVRYVQVNDLNGNVRGAFAAANGQFLVLPMGRDAQHVSTPQHHLALSSGVVPLSSGETIYKDGNLQVTAVPLSSGATTFTATTDCSAHPEDCVGHIQ